MRASIRTRYSGVRLDLDFTRDLPAEVAARLDEVGERFTDADPGFRRVIEILEMGEEQHFRRLRGKYVRTGRLKASLTSSVSPDAIREVHRGGIDFGSGVFYAKFLTKGREMSAGQIKGNRRSRKKSAVLVLTPKTRKLAAEAVLDYIMEPVK